VASGALLSALSLALVLYSGSAEPFIVFRWYELVLIGGIGTIVVLLFAGWAVALVRGFIRAPRRSPRTTVLACASILWTGINLFYLGDSIRGYAQDLRNPRLPASP